MSYRSIYDGDDLFTVIEKKKFQYKLGEDGTAKSFILEITWTDEYPEVLPNISLDAFYNKHIIPSVKEQILEYAKSEGTYGLIMIEPSCLNEILQEPVYVLK